MTSLSKNLDFIYLVDKELLKSLSRVGKFQSCAVIHCSLDSTSNGLREKKLKSRKNDQEELKQVGEEIMEA